MSLKIVIKSTLICTWFLFCVRFSIGSDRINIFLFWIFKVIFSMFQNYVSCEVSFEFVWFIAKLARKFSLVFIGWTRKKNILFETPNILEITTRPDKNLCFKNFLIRQFELFTPWFAKSQKFWPIGRKWVGSCFFLFFLN